MWRMTPIHPPKQPLEVDAEIVHRDTPGPQHAGAVIRGVQGGKLLKSDPQPQRIERKTTELFKGKLASTRGQDAPWRPERSYFECE